MKTEVTFNTKEQKRLKVLNEVEAGRLTDSEAVGVSMREAQRLEKAYREQEAPGRGAHRRGWD